MNEGICALCVAVLALSACGEKETEADAPPQLAAPTIAALKPASQTATAFETTFPPIEHGDGVIEPTRGDPLRKALLDDLRPKIVRMLGVPVEFSITTLRIKDDWAFAILEPVKPGGAGPIAFSDTKLKDEEGEWDGLRTEVLWRKKNEGWKVAEYAVGATDVWYEPFCDEAPKGLIPICANRTPK